MNFESSFKPKLIYVFRINDDTHRGCVKVGETYVKDAVSDITALQPNSHVLNKSAKDRINQYTQTAGITYDLLHTELTLGISLSGITSFNDGEVHKILRRSGIKQKFFGTEKKANEWFCTDLETVKNAIKAAKEGRQSLLPGEVSHDRNPIEFRPEQRAAIDQAKKKFKKGNQFLWNAKMRFGKTLSALQLVKECQYKKTLILTHRPVVDDGWFDDFGKIFYDQPNYQYGSKNKGESFANLSAKPTTESYIYFASIQDLRGSELVGGNFDKNLEVFSTDWNLIIIDEAHEGTKTSLGEAVLTELTKPDTKVLRLSGTPFNLLDDMKEDEIFTWDYVMEQRAKAEWDLTHWGDPNPYACLPRLNIYTYDLSLELKKYQDEEHAFNFKEFFRTNQEGDFIHNADVDNFLNLLASHSDTSQYPYSTLEWRQNFRHSLWTVPGVKEARALSRKLQQHPVFSMFEIVNVAGEGDEDAESDEALAMVRKAIGADADKTWTITLSCGRLTTGVSVKEWTAVFMLSGSFNTSASSYMQTIFRVQTPANINGKQKQECFVFDFAPDRTLKVLAETAKISSRAGKTSESDREIIGKFLNFCPVISFHGSKMSSIDVPHMMQQLKRVYVERVVRNGFEDGYLYNDNLFRLDAGELNDFAELKKIVGQTKSMPKSGDIDVNKQGFTKEEYEKLEEVQKKAKKNNDELTEEEKRLLEERKEKKKNRDTAISILRGISIRMPMILYGAEIEDEEKEITIDNFTSLIDSQSWEEFMPKGVSKQKFNAFKKYYDPDIFAAAGKRIRALARAADQMDVEERIERITSIFITFRNPDKETVLTPWRVVNMHLGDTLGGYSFFNETHDERLDAPRYIDHDEVTAEVFSPTSRILEINSKSGLYPLYAAYSIYRRRLAQCSSSQIISPDAIERQKEEHLRLWDKTLAENLFIVCKTPMAKSITRRTLAGFRQAKVNTRHFEDLINQITNKREQVFKRMKDGDNYWKANKDRKMKFDAIIGNPPYQVASNDDRDTSRDKPVFNLFVDFGKALSPKYLTLVTPSRWMAGGLGLSEFREKMLNDTRIKQLTDYPSSKDVFPNVEIKGGVSYFLWQESYSGLCSVVSCRGEQKSSPVCRLLNEYDIFVRDSNSIVILKKVLEHNEESITGILSVDKEFGWTSNFDGFNKDSNAEEIPLYYNRKSNRLIGSIARSEVSKSTHLIDTWKVMVPKAGSDGGARIPDIVLSKNFVAPCPSVCTQTYLFFYTDTENKAMNISKYVCTRFLRFLVSLRKMTQDATKATYTWVPLQDFTISSDIDWSKPIADIDRQLYAKYHLTSDEITFIEKMIKPME